MFGLQVVFDISTIATIAGVLVALWIYKKNVDRQIEDDAIKIFLDE